MVLLTDKQVRGLRDVTDIARSKGNFDANDYMLGMANGLTLALAIVDEKEPDYLRAPAPNVR